MEEQTESRRNYKPEVIIDGDDIIFPKDDMEMYYWMENFLDVATQHREELGMSVEQLEEMENQIIKFYMSIRKEQLAKEAYEQSLIQLEKSRKALEKAQAEKQKKDL